MFMQTNATPSQTQALAGVETPRIDAKPQRHVGLIAGTLVETAAGWRAVELLRAGDRVQTYDGGPRQIRRVERAYYGAGLGGYALESVLYVPGGAIGNCDAMYLMPEQQVLIENYVIEELLGTSSVLLPASALAGYRGISHHVSLGLVEAIILDFDDEEIVYANSGVLMHCVKDAGTKFFTVLDHEKAKVLIALLDRDPQVLEQAIATLKLSEPELLAA